MELPTGDCCGGFSCIHALAMACKASLMSTAVPSLHGDIGPVGSTVLHALLILLIRLQEASMLLQAPAASAHSTRLIPHKPGELMHPGYAWSAASAPTGHIRAWGSSRHPKSPVASRLCGRLCACRLCAPSHLELHLHLLANPVQACSSSDLSHAGDDGGDIPSWRSGARGAWPCLP